ncbi:hypothetical protein [Candidatus Rhodobacter oscarellae]|uniref:hypothetical protein n=1 Tax=Candidatus Rhodobacter oscarellae TaxID=1675527 RepID=UPI0006712E16|nr:hypothetical protein [Candidatus Rhodobacter lobularis]
MSRTLFQQADAGRAGLVPPPSQAECRLDASDTKTVTLELNGKDVTAREGMKLTTDSGRAETSRATARDASSHFWKAPAIRPCLMRATGFPPLCRGGDE